MTEDGLPSDERQPDVLDALEATGAILPGLWLWVHQGRPAEGDLDGFSGAFVRAANGNGTIGNGFDFSQNYARWARAYAQSRCVAWTFLYPNTTHGRAAAEALVGAAPNAPAYVADVEDFKSQPGGFPRAEIELFYERMAELRPRVPVGFTSYPTRKQCLEHHVDWDALLAGASFGSPQAYWQYQLQKYEAVVGDHHQKPVHMAFAPSNTGEATVPVAKRAIAQFGGISIWVHPLGNEAKRLVKLIGGDGTGAVHVTLAMPVLDLRHAATETVRHPAVRRLQALLVAAECLESTEIDGAAGQITKEALNAFQQSKQLDEMSIVGAKTWRALIEG